MIQIDYSNRPSRLLDELRKAVCARRAAAGPWETIHLVVPNRHLEGALRRHLAVGELESPLAVAANLRFWFLGELMAAGLPRGTRVLDRTPLEGTLLRRFQTRSGLEHPDLAPVRHYLEGPSPERRCAQLAARFGELFETYLLARPGWAAAWAAQPDPPLELDSMERCQRRLWSMVREDLTQSTVDWILPDAARSRLQADLGSLPGELLVFGLGPTAPVYHRYLAALAERGVSVRIYALNPCREYWDDTPDPGARRAVRQAAREQPKTPPDPEDPYQLLDPDAQDQPLLRRWGRPGREMMFLLNELGDWDFNPAFEEPGRATLLAALQQDVLDHLPPRPMLQPEAAAADGSIRIHDCPTMAREAETIAEQIWEEVQAGKGRLRFSDLAIVLPPGEQDAYTAHLRAAFQGAPGIPMAQAEKGSSALEEAVEGFLAFLELAAGGFTRARVLGLLGLPAISRKLGIRDTDTWAAWCQRLGIVRGWDQKDLGAGYFSEDLLSWDQGIRRMALGAFMDPAEGPFEAGNQQYAPLDLATGLLEEAGEFVDTLDHLHRDLLLLAAGQHLPLMAWAKRFSSLAGRWLGGEEDPDKGALAKVQATLGQIGFLEPKGLGGTEYPYGVAAQLARQCLERLRAQGLSLRPDGVVVGTYGSLRGLPFAVVFLPGLGEGRFPAKSAPDDLDLRAAPGRREPGDILAYERDRYFFLETLLGAREKVILSYLGHHAVTGEELAVSPVLGDLKEALKPMLPGIELDRCGLVRRHPLRRWDPDRFREGGWGHLQRPVVREEAGLAALREAHRLQEAPAQWRPAVNLPEARPQEEVQTVTLRQLERFLKAPMQGAAAAALGLREVRDDGSELEAEPVSTAFLEVRQLKREAFLAYRRSAGQGSLQDCYLDVRARLAGEARTALGVLGDLEAGRDLPALMTWDRALAPEVRLTRIRFGAGAQELDAQADQLLPGIPFHFEIGKRKVEALVVGLTGAWADCGGLGPVVLEDGDGEGMKLPKQMKLLLGPWVDHLACQAQAFVAGLETPAAAPVPVHVLLALGDPPYQRLQLPALAPGAAHELLGRLVQSLLGEVHGHPLPVEWTSDLSYAQYKAKAADDWNGEFGGANSCAYGPLSSPEARGPALEPVFLAARARLEPLLTTIKGGQS